MRRGCVPHSRPCLSRVASPQVVVLERDAQIPQQPADEVYTDGDEYARDGVARRGVPQYVQIHGMLAKVGHCDNDCGVTAHRCPRNGACARVV